MFCPYCGNENEEKNRFCVHRESSLTEEVKKEVRPPKPRSEGILVLCFVILFVYGLGITLYKLKNPSKTSGQRVAAPTQPQPIVQKIDFPAGIDKQEFNLNPNGWILVKIPQGSKYQYSCPPGTKIRLPNGVEIINSPYRHDRLGTIYTLWMKGSGKATVSIQRFGSLSTSKKEFTINRKESTIDIIGKWQGTYDDNGFLPINFEMELSQTGEVITGTFSEENPHHRSSEPSVLKGTVKGSISGKNIALEKHYTNINWNPVTYNGTLNKDGTKAEGLGWGFIWSMRKR